MKCICKAPCLLSVPSAPVLREKVNTVAQDVFKWQNFLREAPNGWYFYRIFALDRVSDIIVMGYCRDRSLVSVPVAGFVYSRGIIRL